MNHKEIEEYLESIGWQAVPKVATNKSLDDACMVSFREDTGTYMLKVYATFLAAAPRLGDVKEDV